MNHKPRSSKRTGQSRSPRGRLAGAAPPPAPQATASGFSIVGLGASAGGLEALEQFLRNVPRSSGLAFVIVQHLDPAHECLMVELLQRCTPMKVVQVTNRLRVQPDSVYVIPPNKDLTLKRGLLHLQAPAAARGLRLPIDLFFRSLAEAQRERSVGVILSGMGSDGTQGLAAIKEHAGVTLVQAPGDAKFAAMPRSAIDAGLADIVAPAEELPGKLVQSLRHTPRIEVLEPLPEDAAQSQLERIVSLLREQTGQDFSLYKPSTLYRRIERRQGLHQLPDIRAYARYLHENAHEVELLYKELLIGVTSFFRDPAVWQQLGEEVLPALLRDRPAGSALRAWVPGCSTGEEAYSLAIVLQEGLARMQPRRNYAVQIFATDLDRRAVDKARQGFFPATIAAAVSPERLQRFFVQEEHGYRVAKEIRDWVIFAPQNLIMDPPFTKLDVLCCRNLLIYFAPKLQQRLLPLFHYSLKPGGVLLLGSAESIGGFASLFAPVRDGKSRLFRRREVGRHALPVEFPSAFVKSPVNLNPSAKLPVEAATNLQHLAEQWLMQHQAPAAVLTTAQGDILFVNGRTGRYLEPAAGTANWNVFVMAREELRYPLTRAFQKVCRAGAEETVRGLKIGTEERAHFVDLTVRLLDAPEALRGMVMIVFAAADAPAPATRSGRGKSMSAGSREAKLARELQQVRQELQTTREEMQTAQEEFKSVTEELQSTNEELQSTNEELTTSKEEMQSLNEELQTVNAELQAKVDELSTASNDMKNLLNSTEIATLFLDHALHVRRFTESATKIIKLIPGDVGRPVTDLASDLLHAHLTEDAREVLRSLRPIEKSLATRDGRWFAMRMMPYRTSDNRIDGVVITFTEITASKRAEVALRVPAGERKPEA